ncbi:uncharacterized protein LOC131948535 isoform X1 [Physella acuta]|uniref:uncharacterized protein LOC131948535 isoform X1 n=1 Tax=Physella acuta TaxID=109671 RepID=UPI0027DAFEA3|nr:uncharacterized protein LOC131948535 isoform X1 [Physella acuta]
MIRFNDQLEVKRIIIIATPNSNYGFSINLKNWNEQANRSNCTAYGNVALHMAVRFFQSRVIFNSRGSKWAGKPSVLGRVPFAKDVQFKLQITIRSNRYELLFDDGSVFNWDHRTEDVDMVCIDLDLTVHSILTT